MKRVIALFLLLLCAWTACFAETVLASEYEEAHQVVGMLLRAVVGTDEKYERKIREKMTETEAEARNEENASYRARVLPWLLEVLKQETEAEQDEAEEQTDSMQRVTDAFCAFEDNDYGKEYLNFLREAGAGSIEECLQLTREYYAIWCSEIDAERLKEENPDFQCWLYCQDTLIDYPVVQCQDNDTYLHRMFNGDENSAGTIFIDYRNLPEFEDPNTLVYGHHMRNGSMFGNLVKYKDQWYYESHPYYLIITEDGSYICEVFAGYTTRMDDHCYDIAISDEEDFEEFVMEARSKSDFINGSEVQPEDHLLTLSTCAYAFQYARYIVIVKIVR